MRPADQLLYLTLARIPFLSPGERIKLSEILDDHSSLLRISSSDLQCLLGRSLHRQPRKTVATIQDYAWRPELYIRDAEGDRTILARSSIRCVLYSDDDYPPLLREIYDPPLLLFYRGRLPDYEKPLVGVVGTRRPTGGARSAAFSLGWELASNGIGVVSGLAQGIDVAAHRGCVKNGGSTVAPAVAVLGNGLRMVYPRSHKKAARDIIDHGGVLLSEYPPNELPQPYHFPQRNRIISGLARSLVVVQAPSKSGALITADYALEQGRDLFVHEAGLQGSVGEGSKRLADQGAGVIRHARDILSDWGWKTVGSCPPEAESGWVKGKSLARLMEMELAGEIYRENGRYYRKSEGGT